MTRAGWISIAVLCAFGTSAFAGGDKKKKKKPPPPQEEEAPPPDPAPEPEPPPPPPADDTPWSKGVTPQQKAEAQRLLDAGNELFLQSNYRDALTKYQDAVGQWDHPAIRFNMVRALVALDRPLEAYESLEKALAYGQGPLEDQLFSEALNYQRLLEGQIATLSVACKQDGVQISVDGEPWLTCPGAKAVRTLPGNHAVVGKKEGYLTSTQDVVLMPGSSDPIDVSLQSLQQATRTRTKWATWKPWAVAGGGAALAGLGVLLNVQAGNDMDAYESNIARTCAEDGCSPDMVDNTLESRALTENRVAIGMMAAGGAVIVAGVTMVIMNRPQTYIPEERGTVVTPTVTSSGAGVSISGRF
jgi:hypothetical protein